jgi:hypothetical protein
MNTIHRLSVPLARTNATALATTAAVMLFLVCYQPEEFPPVEFIRANALLLIAAHAGLHALTLNSLKFLDLLEIAEARPALTHYRDPRRVSHLDLAAAWLGFYALTPYVVAAI